METANKKDKQSVFHCSAPVDRRNTPAKICLLNTSLSLCCQVAALNRSKSRATADGGMADGREEKDECPKATFRHCQRLLWERLHVCLALVRASQHRRRSITALTGSLHGINYQSLNNSYLIAIFMSLLYLSFICSKSEKVSATEQRTGRPVWSGNLSFGFKLAYCRGR